MMLILHPACYVAAVVGQKAHLMLSSEEIKGIILCIIELHLTEGIS